MTEVLLVRLVMVVTAPTVMRVRLLVVQAALEVTRVLLVAVESVVLVRHPAVVVPMAPRLRLVVMVAMVVTGTTRTLMATRLLERQVVMAVTVVQPAVWVTAELVVMAVTVRQV